MRVLLLSAALVTITSAGFSQARAQGLNAGGLMRLPGVAAKETSPVQRLPKSARLWIEEERARQLAEPGDLIELAFEIETSIGPAILKVAERERIDTRDLILVVMHDILSGASDQLDSQLRKLRRDGAPQADVQSVVGRQTLLAAKLAEVVQSQSVSSRTLIAAQ